MYLRMVNSVGRGKGYMECAAGLKAAPRPAADDLLFGGPAQLSSWSTLWPTAATTRAQLERRELK